ncbi:MAG: hypothetical protein K1X78_18100 [Verrucomicrobiaceae bacterium]|nr:hypothetical protein [Verrucomicrobiaceae bacterium]
MNVEVIVVAEARADFEMAFGLTRRMSKEVRPNCSLASRGLESEPDFTQWKNVCEISARHKRIRRFSLERGAFRGGDAETAWQVAAVSSLQPIGESVRVILLVRDTDNDKPRAQSLGEEVSRLQQNGIAFLLAQPHPKREAWILNGFVPGNSREEQLLKGERNRLNFDPVLHSDRLTSKGNEGERNAKRVVKLVTDGDKDREADCWRAVPLEDLRKRGSQTGLKRFLDGVQTWLVQHVPS